ncbi:MAG: hypothetical protein ABJC10_07915 [Acidobacteriota bacterium]
MNEFVLVWTTEVMKKKGRPEPKGTSRLSLCLTASFAGLSPNYLLRIYPNKKSFLAIRLGQVGVALAGWEEASSLVRPVKIATASKANVTVKIRSWHISNPMER